MGAHDYTRYYDFYSRAKVVKAWDELVEEDMRESGSGAYAGNSTTMNGNIEFYDSRLASLDKAIDYVLDKHEKWTNPVACSFYLPSELTANQKARSDKAREAYYLLQGKVAESQKKIINDFYNRKSKMVGCPKCESRLNLAFLRSSSYLTRRPGCPLCKAPLLSQTAQDRYDALSSKLEKENKKCIALSTPKASKSLGWVVGGWAAC
jgi:hypothetical protein